MKKIVVISALLIVSQAVVSQVKVGALPATTVGVKGDFLIKDDSVGTPGSTKKISAGNFISAYSIQTAPTATTAVHPVADSSIKIANTAFVHRAIDSLAAHGSGSGWSLTGNSGTTPGSNFIGTTDDKYLMFKVNNTASGLIQDSVLQNTGFGYGALNYNTVNLTTGNSGTAFGYKALYANTSGFENTAVGNFTMITNTTGGYNTAIGGQALQKNTSGSYNAAMGYYCLQANTTGSYNVGIGLNVLQKNTTASYNVGVGYEALNYNSANYNTGFGYQALLNNTTGMGNTALGTQALVGTGLAGYAMGNYNTAAGYLSLQASTSGTQNSGFGVSSLYNTTTGGYNTAIGVNAGNSNTTGSHNTFLGNYANSTTGGLVNATAIGDSAIVSASNALILGGTGYRAVSVGIGNTAPNASAVLEVTSTTAGFRITPMTSTQASAITPVEGLILFVSTTNGTFTSVGLWDYENGAWHKL